jgi:hypothetical protein
LYVHCLSCFLFTCGHVRLRETVTCQGSNSRLSNVFERMCGLCGMMIERRNPKYSGEKIFEHCSYSPQIPQSALESNSGLYRDQPTTNCLTHGTAYPGLITVYQSCYCSDFTRSHLSGSTAAARSKACVCGRSLAWIADSNPSGGMDVCLL